jgi:hypothetical protein
LDAAAPSVFELAPGQTVGRNISLYGLSKDHLSLLRTPQPKYRARLRYFPSREAWVTFGKSHGHESKSQPSILIALPSSAGNPGNPGNPETRGQKPGDRRDVLETRGNPGTDGTFSLFRKPGDRRDVFAISGRMPIANQCYSSKAGS